jgi:hypothetical protein
MTDAVPPQDGPQELLSATRRLSRRVRQAQRGTWFPLLLFAGLTLASIPIIRYNRHPIDCRVLHPSGRICIAFAPWSYVYWLLASVLAYAAIAAFYVNRAHERGVGTRVRPYVITGVISAIVATGVSLWLVTHPGGVVGYPSVPPSPATEFLYRLVSPEGAIGLALLVLAWVERNRALLVFGLVYLVIVGFGWTLIPRSLWLFAVTTAVVLLLGSAGFALAERHAGRAAS